MFGRLIATPVAAACLLQFSSTAQAITFETEGGITGNFDSTISIGTGIRTRNPDCTLILASPSGPNAPAGCISPSSGLGDQGDLNYARGDAFTTYLKGNHELLLKFPGQVTFLGRVNWLRDFTSTHTTGIASAADPGPPAVVAGLSDEARSALKFKARVLDLWVSKSFQVGEETARVRVGNQVVNWGESLFLPGGINSTNALDLMRLSQPGTQLKEAVLPAPMVSVASGLGKGFNIEGYVQTRWNRSYFPPTGSYWSVANGLGDGDTAYGLVRTKPKDSGQWGLALRYQPDGTQLNLGLYALNYHDKTPNLSINAQGTGQVGWVYAENRRLYGISANFPVGDVAVGTELSYRPKDAVFINPAASGCASQNGNCWVDEKRVQWALTALYSATPSNAKGLLNLLGADTATLLAETVVIAYPGLKRSYGGDPISAGGWGWGQEQDPGAAPVATGTRYSSGVNFDFSWNYDGTLVKGWQVIPEVYYFQALSGRTPNASGLFMAGAKSANFIVSFIQNPANWQFSINYAIFRGGKSIFDQPYRDRDFVGMTLSRNL